jgi:hypothetical protein
MRETLTCRRKAAGQMEMAIRPKDSQAALADVAATPHLYSIRLENTIKHYEADCEQSRARY